MTLAKLKFIAVSLLFLVVFAACGGSEGGDDLSLGYSDETIAQGKTIYNQTCFACHGPDAKGVSNLGKDLTTSEFFAEKTDEELLAYVLEGRSVDDPLNTTGIAMPPKGGFDFLTDTDILAAIAYLRTLQE